MAPPTTPSSSPIITSRYQVGTSAALDIQWGSSTGADFYTLRVRRGYDNETTFHNTSNTSISITGLQFAVTYHFQVRASNSDGDSNWTSENPGTTAPRIPTISATSTTSTSIEITASGMSGNWDDITIERLTTGNVFIDSKTVTSGSMSSTWTGLSSGQQFNFRARSRFNINNVDLFSAYSSTITVTVPSTRPSNFSWTYAGANLTTGAPVSGTDKSNSLGFYLTDDEWNNFTDRINEFRTYKGLSTVSFTVAVTNNNFTATIFNEARTAINGMSPSTPVPSSKSAGNNINASDLNGLKNSLNSIS